MPRFAFVCFCWLQGEAPPALITMCESGMGLLNLRWAGDVRSGTVAALAALGQWLAQCTMALVCCVCVCSRFIGACPPTQD